MVTMMALDGTAATDDDVQVGKAFNRPSFASGLLQIPPMTTKPNANTGANTLVSSSGMLDCGRMCLPSSALAAVLAPVILYFVS